MSNFVNAMLRSAVAEELAPAFLVHDTPTPDFGHPGIELFKGCTACRTLYTQGGRGGHQSGSEWGSRSNPLRSRTNPSMGRTYLRNLTGFKVCGRFECNA